jgi:hypothetical protein
MKRAQDRTIPVCFASDKLSIIKEYATTRGMTSYEQAIDELIKSLDET